jgi:hypothetical protein
MDFTPEPKDDWLMTLWKGQVARTTNANTMKRHGTCWHHDDALLPHQKHNRPKMGGFFLLPSLLATQTIDDALLSFRPQTKWLQKGGGKCFNHDGVFFLVTWPL